ncbi:MAG: DUF3341 domain-containing protein [Planctomycetota bacterium]
MAKHSHTTSQGVPMFAMLAEFANPAAVSHAAEHFRDAGYKKWDVFAPIPIHGIDHAMGLKPSKVSFFTAFGAINGFTIALVMQWWMASIDYKIVTAGKPLFAWEQFTPILFELSVLLASICTITGMLLLNGLPRHHHPLLRSERFLGVSDDKFIIAVEASDPGFDPATVRAEFEKLGGFGIEEIEEA